MANTSWFEVSRKGLAKLVADKDRSFILYELVQNALDEEGVTHIDVRLGFLPGRSLAWLSVRDNGQRGFRDLTHAYTLFEESYKKDNPLQRGRFNLGEKLTLALCKEARIVSTQGGVQFTEKGRRWIHAKTERGTDVSLLLKLTRAQGLEIEQGLDRLLLPKGVVLTYERGEFSLDPSQVTTITWRPPLSTFETSLPTVLADDEGVLRRKTQRKTTIEVYEAKDGSGWLYEMGIPLVETGDTWSVNIGQKVPLNMDRDNVTPSYLRKVRAAVLNHMAEQLSSESASEAWVGDATASSEISSEAFGQVMDRRFGKKRVMFDPSDPEAGHNAVAHGHVVVRGNQLSEGERQNMRRFRAEGTDFFRPAGQVFPTPKPFSNDPNAKPVDIVVPTGRQVEVVRYIDQVFACLIGGTVEVMLVKRLGGGCAAAYGSRRLTLSVGALGRAWFEGRDPAALEAIHDLLIHELAHHFASNHLDRAYYKACTRLGAKLAGAIWTGRIRPRDFGFCVDPTHG